MASSVATFEDTMNYLIYTLGDREIYNDIRSEVTERKSREICTDPGTPAENDWLELWCSSVGHLSPGETYDYTFDADYEATSWRVGDAKFFEWDGSNYIPGYSSYTLTILSSSSSQCTIRATNTSATDTMAGGFSAEYKYQSSGAIDPTYTTEYYEEIKSVRAVNSASIRKYGRREMQLTWPLGATENEMQGIVNSYCLRYAEPVSWLKMQIQGRTDALKTQILARKISQMITVKCADIGLDDYYFIDSIIIDSPPGDQLLTVRWTLEEARAAEISGYAQVGSAVVGTSIIA